MIEVGHININDYDYSLPEDNIAKYPMDSRDESKLLLRQNGKLSHDIFKNICNYLPSDSLIVFNNTRVINARLLFEKETGSKIEIFCLEPAKPVDYSMALSANDTCSWKCMVGNNKKWKSGILSLNLKINNSCFQLTANRIANQGNTFEIQFSWNNTDFTFAEILENTGNIPIPPYLNRSSEDIDKNRYQTIYGKNRGSVAAPTAGLHFTDKVFADLGQKSISREEITLHVGAGTFQPVKATSITEHEMHTEHFFVTQGNLKQIIKFCGNITAVGTTTVRTLESLFQIAVQIDKSPNKTVNYFFVNQWDAYAQKNEITTEEKKQMLENLLNWMISRNISQLNCATQIMIVPGYIFRLTNRLITNFHQPKSTLLLLLAAFTGDSWKDSYRYAMENNFRFLSYGDSCLFLDKNEE